MHIMKFLLLTKTLLAFTAVAASAELNVVASIKPVHSLVAAIMDGVGEPGLIIESAESPHNYALRPSKAQMLEEADLVFWIGHELETFLEKPLETIGASAKTVALMDAHDLIKLKFRKDGAFEKHDHDSHDENSESGHDDHDHEKKEEARHEGHDHEKTAAADHEDHDHGAFDPHIWLDPANAKAMVHEIKEALIAADPLNAGKYEGNAKAVTAKFDTLIAEVAAELEPVKDKPFIVFHDAYQYFENRFGVTASGSITVSPEVIPGAERIAEIRARMQELGAACVFSEPQFEPKLVATVTEGTRAKFGVIDPLGAKLETGPDLYFELIRNMSASIKTCLSEAS
ncbi:MAG: zinc ABC transporter substrate-binding protein ZnuA [Rhizobiales bacterium]|nr:zinc ABC transporter substrate-binding protein ZnuA [Hyphomicrobiales bacterium]